jgi:hypothetical protein
MLRVRRAVDFIIELETVDGSVTRFLHSHLLDVYIHAVMG